MRRVPPVSCAVIFFFAITSGTGVRPEHAIVTAAPDLTAARGLVLRDSGAVCGYVSGDSNSPLSCPGTSVCTYVGASWGCCDAQACRTPAICEGFGTPYCGIVGSANCIYSQIQQCTDAASPACVTYIRSTGVGDNAKKTSWDCGTTHMIISVRAETLNAATGSSMNAVPTSTQLLVTSESTPDATSPIATSSASVPSPTSTQPTLSIPSTSLSSSSASPSSGTLASPLSSSPLIVSSSISPTPSTGSATVASTSPSPSAASTSAAPTHSSSKGLSEDNKIALGVGLGIGLPSLILAVVVPVWIYKRGRRQAASRGSTMELQNRTHGNGNATVNGNGNITRTGGGTGHIFNFFQ